LKKAFADILPNALLKWLIASSLSIALLSSRSNDLNVSTTLA